jgi:Spy/CpxP family protein refolding chaperone
MRTIGRNITVTILAVTLVLTAIVIAEPYEPLVGRGRDPRYLSDRPGEGQPQRHMRRGATAELNWRSGPGQDTIFQLIERRLDLTDEQREQIRQIRQTHRKEQQNARQTVADTRKALQDAIATDAEPAEIRAAATALGKAIGEQAVVRANTLKAIKEILTDEQIEQLEKIREQSQRFRERARDHEFRERLQPVRGRRSERWSDDVLPRRRADRDLNIYMLF